MSERNTKRSVTLLVLLNETYHNSHYKLPFIHIHEKSMH